MRWNIPAKLTDLTSAGEQELGQLMAYRKNVVAAGEDMLPSAEVVAPLAVVRVAERDKD